LGPLKQDADSAIGTLEGKQASLVCCFEDVSFKLSQQLDVGQYLQLGKHLSDEGADCFMKRHLSHPSEFWVAALFGGISLLAANSDAARRQSCHVYFGSAHIFRQPSRASGKPLHDPPNGSNRLFADVADY
jgi:hypothetical protein